MSMFAVSRGGVRIRAWSRHLLFLTSALCMSGCVSTQMRSEIVYDWRTCAGLPGGLGNVDGKGDEARFCQPCGVAYDAAGNLYVADYYNYAIRRVTPDGSVTTVAGSVGDAGSNDGAGNGARFDRPYGVAADAAGNVYVTDSGNHTLRKVTADGIVTTMAGRAGEQGGADGTGRDARFRSPCGVAVDGSGNVFIADAGNHTIRRVTPSGAVSTVAGLSGAAGYTNAAGSSARFKSPRGVAVDGAGNVYVADTENAVVRKITAAGSVTTLAGGPGNAGFVNATGTMARLSSPYAVAIDAAGNLYVADAGNQVVRKVTQAGVVTTLTNALSRFPSLRGIAVDARTNVAVVDNDLQVVSLIPQKGDAVILAGRASRHGGVDGPAASARFNRPCGVVATHPGRMIVTDSFNQTLRSVTPDGVVTTLAGRVWSMGGSDGRGTNATFCWPAGATRDAAGNVFVADAGNHTIRKVSADGTVVTFAGKSGVSGYTNAVGEQARFSWPADVAADGFGAFYVADRANHVIRKVTSLGATSTLAGEAGKAGRADGTRSAARFNNPSGVAVDVLGNVYVADAGNHTVRKVTPGGEVSTLAGCAGLRGSANGRGYLARFNSPSDLAVDAGGSLYVTDRDNHMIRKVSPDGVVTTLGGMPNVMTCADGLGAEARFAQPSGIWLNDDGGLWVADACNNRMVAGTPRVFLSRLSAPSEQTRFVVAHASGPAPVSAEPYKWEVFAGQPGLAGLEDGRGKAARLSGPQGLAFAADGVLYVADGAAGAIRKVSPDGHVSTLVGQNKLLSAPVGIAVDSAGVCTVTDGSHTLLTVTPRGEVRHLAGATGQRGRADGSGAAARFDFMPGVAADSAGSVYVADSINHTVRRVTPDGVATTVVGLPGLRGTVDGKGALARLDEPTGIAIDQEGNLFVAARNRIRKVDRTGEVGTVAGDAPFVRLDGIAVDHSGNVYVADRGRHAIWKVSTTGSATILGGSEMAMGGSGWLVTGLAVDRAGSVYVADAVRNCIMKGTPAAR